MDDTEQTAIIRHLGSGVPAELRRAGTPAGEAAGEASSAADAAAGLASLSFITSAIRRRARQCWIVAGIGLLLGSGLYVAHPPAFAATTQSLLSLGPNEDLNTSIDTDVALATSRPVAVLALHRLGGQQATASQLLASETATAVTNRVIQIAVKARSADQAVVWADALTKAFIQFRTDQLRQYQQLTDASLNTEITQQQGQVQIITRQLRAARALPASPASSAKVGSLEGQLTSANGSLAALEQSVRAAEDSIGQQTNVAVRGSYVVDAATLAPHHKIKTAATYAAGGLIGGLVLSLGFVVIAALISDKLRWRDDIAHALGAPVRLSVGAVGLRRFPPGRRGLAALGNPRVQAIARHLEGSMPGRQGGDALAVVPADRTDVPALALAATALSIAAQGRKVLIADLCPDAPAARLLGAAGPGVHEIDVTGTPLTVAVPEPGTLVPTGPLSPPGLPARLAPVSDDLAQAHEDADVLLTLAALDPMLGGDHLASWSAEVVVLVTAGEPTWTRIQAVGEMVRLAGCRLAGAVLTGAEKTDESLGGRLAGEPADDLGQHRGGARPQARASMNGSRDAARPDGT